MAGYLRFRPDVHVFSVDVEEYFQVRVFEGVVPRTEWQSYPSRLEPAIHALLALLDRHRATGTFFTLGWIARHHPQVVRAIVSAGHEIASHGYWHRSVTSMTHEEFRADVRSAKAELEDVSGCPVLGFRAPNFSIQRGMDWALDVLVEEGHRYDSSRWPRSGGDSCRVPHVIGCPSGKLLELPPATATVFRQTLRAAGGNYLRQLPIALVRRAFREASRMRVPGMFYIHPWEIDPGQPRIHVGPIQRMRHYRGLSRTHNALDQLLGEFRFDSVAAVYPDLGEVPRTASPECNGQG
jgi:polysaccharide deacetylase family protein (PEP-CTERM system associated)